MSQTYAVSDAKYFDATGAISMLITVTDGGGGAIVKIPHFVIGPDPYTAARAYADQWIADNPGQIAPFVEKTQSERIEDAYRHIVFLANSVTEPILAQYPEAERADWLSKEAEARAFMALDPSSRTRLDAPILNSVCDQQFGTSSDVERLGQIETKATVVIDLAVSWRGLLAIIEGFRSRHQMSLSVTADEVGIAVIIAVAEAEIEAVKVQLAGG